MSAHESGRASANDYFLKYRNESTFNDKKAVSDCFKYFDTDKDDDIDVNEFEGILKVLFSFNGNAYSIPKSRVTNMFTYFDSKKTGKWKLADFEEFWKKIVKPTLFPKNCFLIVDVQNDFIDGTLALINCAAKQDGGEVVPVINELIRTVPFNVIAYTLDWHPQDHCSFIENVQNRPIHEKSKIKENFKTYDTVIFEAYPQAEQKLWPAHCIVDSEGSKLHPKLNQIDEKTDQMNRKVVYVKKGSKSDIDSYSAFFDNCKLNETTLHNDLQKHAVTDLYVCGLAADVCVAATAYDGITLNYRVIFVEDAARGVDDNDIADKKKYLTDNGAIIISSKQVYNMVICKDRRPELAYAIFDTLTKSS